MAGKHAPLGFNLPQDASRLVQRDVQGNRGMEAGEFHSAEVDGVPVSGPLSAVVTVAASGQVCLLVQPCVEERHKVLAHGVILDDAPGTVV